MVPHLANADAELLLVGRDPKKLEQSYPGIRACSYEDLAVRGHGYDVVLHLAAMNNDRAAPEGEFRAVNVDLTLRVANAAASAGIARLVNVFSVHALDASSTHPYARSKREAAAALKSVPGILTETIYLPLVHGDRFSGKAAFLNRWPNAIRRRAFFALAALKPTVHAAQVAAHVLAGPPATRDPAGAEAILSDGQQGNPVFLVTKRIIDLVFAVAVAGLLWWLLALIWVLIRIGSPGPGIFRQERVGRNGATFVCYKFRTMQAGTANLGTHEVSAAAVTRIGAFLRRTKLDELPQIWNILRNEVSLIGPRPCLPVQHDLIAARRALGVLALKPGISGLAQVNGIDMRDPVRLALWDARYLKLQSLLLDIKIILATALGGGHGDRVAR